MKNTAKKSIALLLTMLMLVGVAMPVVGAVEVTSETTNATAGTLLYSVNFKGDSNFTPDFVTDSSQTNYTKATTKNATVSEDGKSVTLSGDGEIYWGDIIGNLPASASTGYEITYTVTRESNVYQGFGLVTGKAIKDNVTSAIANPADNSSTTQTFSQQNVSLKSDNGTYQYKVLFDGVEKKVIYYAMVEATANLPAHYEKILAYSSYTENEFGVYLYSDGSEVTYSNVEIRTGNFVRTENNGKLLLAINGDMTETQKNTETGVTYTPDVDNMNASKPMYYDYDETTGVHSMNADPDSLDADNKYNTKGMFSGSTNLPQGANSQYTITYKYKMNSAGGDSGLAYNTKAEHTHRSMAMFCSFQSNGQACIYAYKYNFSLGAKVNGNYVGSNLFSNADENGFVDVAIELSNGFGNYTVYVNGVKVFTQTGNAPTGTLSLGFVDYTSGAVFGADSTAHTSYKDIKVYSGLTVSNKYVDVIDGDTVKTEVLSGTTTTYTLPTPTEPAGCMFKGWQINGTGETVAAGQTVNTEGLESITAVYTKAMADVWVQFGNTDTEANTTDMRIVGVLDSLNYKAIGYDVVIKYTDSDGNPQEYKSDDYELHNVYNSLLAKYGTEVVTPETLKFGADSGYYLTAFTIFNVPTNIGEITFELTPYQIDLDGNKMPGEKITLSFTEMWAKNNASGN